MIRADVASSVCAPNIMVPRQIGEIFRPLRPSCRYSIGRSFELAESADRISIGARPREPTGRCTAPRKPGLNGSHFINRWRVVVKRDDLALRRHHPAEYRRALRGVRAPARERTGAGAEAGRRRPRAGRGGSGRRGTALLLTRRAAACAPIAVNGRCRADALTRARRRLRPRCANCGKSLALNFRPATSWVCSMIIRPGPAIS